MPDSTWQKSSYSGSSNACVEVRRTGRFIELRESDEGHLTLRTSPSAFAALLHSVKAGDFHHNA